MSSIGGIKNGVYMFINSDLIIVENGHIEFPDHLWFWIDFDVDKFFKASIYLSEL